MKNLKSIVLITKVFAFLFLATTFITPIPEDDTTYCVDLPELSVKASDYVQIDTTDWNYISKVVFSESGNQSDSGQIATANVILNRSRNRGMTVKQVIFEPGQFDGIRTKYFRTKPSERSIKAAKLALLGVKIVDDRVEYFHNPKISTDKKWIRYISKYLYKSIGDHDFCMNPKLLNTKTIP